MIKYFMPLAKKHKDYTMKNFRRFILAIILVLAVVISSATATAFAAEITTTPSGYTSAEQVVYKTTSGKIHNWGARGEDATFLSTYAESFYTGSYAYEELSSLAGGTSTSNAYKSELYTTLKQLMTSKHTHQTTYGDTRYQYQYTDCVANNNSQISSFYSGSMFTSTWDSGATWNREHTWPASKSLSGRPGNSDDGEGADIMMLRPTLKSENGSRGNKAYGESSSFHNPGESVHGDVARIALYVYTRWGNTTYMWGSGGVIESLDVLLKWMEEDPVDTWEMGRNDAVQSITGTRNVFVDYPELAFTLFGEDAPTTMTTPSGNAANSTTPDEPDTPDTPDEPDTPDTPDEPDTPDTPDEPDTPDTPDEDCTHQYGTWIVVKAPTSTEDGIKKHTCKLCGHVEEVPMPSFNSQSGCKSSMAASLGGAIFLSAVVLAFKKRR